MIIIHTILHAGIDLIRLRVIKPVPIVEYITYIRCCVSWCSCHHGLRIRTIKREMKLGWTNNFSSSRNSQWGRCVIASYTVFHIVHIGYAKIVIIYDILGWLAGKKIPSVCMQRVWTSEDKHPNRQTSFLFLPSSECSLLVAKSIHTWLFQSLVLWRSYFCALSWDAIRLFICSVDSCSLSSVLTLSIQFKKFCASTSEDGYEPSSGKGSSAYQWNELERVPVEKCN